MKIKQGSSPNSSRRRKDIKYIVIHWTGGAFEPSVSWLCNSRSEASAHYVISKEGEIIQLLNHCREAWHAGRSKYEDDFNLNQTSIGIELEGPPSRVDGMDKWPVKQMHALIDLCNKIIEDEPTIEIITDHATIRQNYIDYLEEKGISLRVYKKIDVTQAEENSDIFPWTEICEQINL